MTTGGSVVIASSWRNSLGVRVVPMSRAFVPALRDGFGSGSASQTTLYRLPLSLPAAHAQHARIKQLPHARRYAIVDRTRRLIGTCILAPHTFAGMELAIAIFDARYRAKGVGTFAVRYLCRVAFTKMKAHRVELGVYPDNARAISVYERAGFRREALLRRFMYHDGKWRDLLWMSLLRDEWRLLTRNRKG